MNRFAAVLITGSCVLLGGSAAVFVPPLLVVPAAAQQGTAQATPAANDPLTALGDRFEVIARQILPTVVSIEAVKPAKTLPGSTAKGKPVEESGIRRHHPDGRPDGLLRAHQ